MKPYIHVQLWSFRKEVSSAKNRAIISAWKSLAMVAANMKHMKLKHAPVIGHFLPYSSPKGANANGRVANPQV
jgi:hypothetical protein